MIEQPTIYIILGVILLLVLISIVLMLKSRKKPLALSYDPQPLLELFKVDNVLSIDYKRDKIHVHLRQTHDIDFNALKTFNVNGVNVVGDVVKFYFKENNELYYALIKEAYESQVKP